MASIAQNKNWNKIIIASFLSVPILASIISTLHIVHFFGLGNPDWMAYFLAITFEIGSIASFVALSVMHKIKKSMIIFIFVVLFFLQLVGNVYFSFEYVNLQLVNTTSWLNNFIELCRPLFGDIEQSTYKFILAITIGVPIPLVSLSFLKSLVDYLHVDLTSDSNEIAVQPDIETVTSTSINEVIPVIKRTGESKDDTALYSTVQ